MIYVKERAAVILRELKACAVTRSLPLTEFTKKDGFFLRPEDADTAQGLPFSPETEAAVSQDGHFWLTAFLSIPESFDQGALWLSISDSHNGWASENPQLLIFCNEEIIQAGDSNHREVILLPQACPGETLRLDLQIYAGTACLPAGSLCFCLQQRDLSVEKLCYDLSVPIDILSWIAPDTSDSVRLEQILQKAVNLIDLRETDSDTFAASVCAADSFLEQELYNSPDARAPIASCVGHTHIDIAWWWTVQQTREKAVRSFSTALKLMDEYPEYRFISSQPQLYAFVKERYPELFDKIRSRVLEGRWEVEGGMWLEADCNLISGESMIRQILFGKEFFRKEFGKDTRVCWLPDVFGYSAAMPQILKKSGIDYFMTTKISWNQFNKLPMDTFWWKGIDGTEIFTHLITTQDASQPKTNFSTTYNGNLNAVSVIRAWERYQQKDCACNVLLSCGFGDGGGGTTREMLENARRLSFGIAGTPKVRWDFSRTYFDRLLEQCDSNPSLPRWVGELYLEYHRGTYTSMARNKKSNRKSELMLQQIEQFSAWATRFGFSYPAKKLHLAWEKVLLNQFHDILPGSSIHEVYEVTAQEYHELEELFHQLLSDALSALASHSGAPKGELLVFSPLCFAHSATIETDSAITALRGSDGSLYIGQQEENHTLFSLPLCDATGISRFHPEILSCEAPSPFLICGQELETPFYRIRFAKDGTIASLYDKEAQRELTAPGGALNRLTAYEDKPMDFDNWDIDIYYTEKSWPLDCCTMEWIRTGPVRATLRVVKPFLHSEIRQDIHFYADRREIVFDTTIDWKQHQLLLKADFDFDIHADTATYDIQFGNLSRPTHKNTSWDMARFEVCAHKWADLSEEGYGAALLNDCKYGYSAEGSKLSLTLLKSGIVPNPVADQELHRFRYALYPHIGNWRAADVPKAAYAFNIPAISFCQTADPVDDRAEHFIRLSGDGIMLETVKQAEDGDDLIVRLYEYKNCRTNATLCFDRCMESVYSCNLLEEALKPASYDQNRLYFSIKPYEILTFRIRFRD